MEAGLGRLEGRISAICVPVLCDGHWAVGQRTRHTGDNPQICGSARPIFWECAPCVPSLSLFSLMDFSRSVSWICEFLVREGVATL